MPITKTIVLFQHLALGTLHHHWQTLGPLPYKLNLFAIKSQKTDFVGLQMIGGFFLKKLRKTQLGKIA